MPAVPRAALGLGAMLAVLAAAPATAMDFKLIQQPNGHTMLQGRGPIVPGDFHRLLEYVNTMEKIQHMDMLVFDSPGGFVDEAERMAYTIHNVGLPVTIGKGNLCVSACVLLFAAAPSRTAAAGALIGVHRAANFKGQENQATLGATDGMTVHYELYGVPPPIIAKMRGTPPGGITWLTREDLALMHVTVDPPTPDGGACASFERERCR